MNAHQLLLFAALCSLGFSSAIPAEEIKVGVSQQAPEKQTISRPANGLTQTQVTAQYGSPMAIEGPVGDPPITTWRYEDFTVYYEYDRVVHTVLNFRSSN